MVNSEQTRPDLRSVCCENHLCGRQGLLIRLWAYPTNCLPSRFQAGSDYRFFHAEAQYDTSHSMTLISNMTDSRSDSDRRTYECRPRNMQYRRPEVYKSGSGQVVVAASRRREVKLAAPDPGNERHGQTTGILEWKIWSGDLDYPTVSTNLPPLSDVRRSSKRLYLESFKQFIHSAVGNKMVGADNSWSISLCDPERGDQVEVIPPRTARPNCSDWLNIVKHTGQGKIASGFELSSKDNIHSRGKEMNWTTSRTTRQKGIVYSISNYQ